MPYKSVEDLLKEEGFLDWYFGTDEDQVARWTAWIVSSEQNAELARQAYDLLESIGLAERKELREEQVKKMWAVIEARMRNAQK